MKARIFEQVDVTAGKATYSWILDGLKRSNAGKLPGWKWVGGRPGSFVTNDPDLAATTANRIGADVVSNGTHAVHGVPVLLCDPRLEPDYAQTL